MMLIAIADDIIKPFEFIQYSTITKSYEFPHVESYKGIDFRRIIGVYIGVWWMRPDAQYPITDAVKGDMITYKEREL